MSVKGAEGAIVLGAAQVVDGQLLQLLHGVHQVLRARRRTLAVGDSSRWCQFAITRRCLGMGSSGAWIARR
jgi:hypothetical protein